MTYQQAVFYVEQTQFARRRCGIERLKEILTQMGNPQQKGNWIHVAGTNGKGSCCAMTASILSKAGYRVGLYTSPHLERYNERIKINGEDISDEDFIEQIEAVKQVCDKMGEAPIVFEVLTLAALRYFAQKRCDFVVLEVGIGGRLDATNVIPAPKAAVIAQLGLDHTETLGNTIEEIAREKGGIIKAGTPVILAKQSEEATEEIRKICSQTHSELRIASPERFMIQKESINGFSLTDSEYGELFLPLAGRHQLCNAANVLETISCLKRQGYRISNQAVQEGLLHTRWAARFERLSVSPDFILDGGHNPQCVGAAVESLKRYYPRQKAVFIVGMMQDKDTGQMLEQLLELAKQFICIEPDSQRAMTAEQMTGFLQEKGAQAQSCKTAEQAIALAIRSAGKDGLVCALGSLYLAGEIREIFEKNSGENFSKM